MRLLPLLLLGACAPDLVSSIEATASAPACALDGSVALAAACTDDSLSVRTAPLDADTAPVVEVSRTYGLQLVDAAGQNGGAVRLVAPVDGEYIVYLGTPNMPMTITGPDGDVVPTCSTRLTGDTCPWMRRALGVHLVRGAEYRVEIGPIAPQRWLRWRIEPRRQTPIAFAVSNSGSYDLFTFDPASGRVTTLVTAPGDQTLPRWSPDGERVAYVSAGQLAVTDRAGHTQVVAPRVGRAPYTVTAPAWTPDSQRLVYPYPRDPYIVIIDDEAIDESYQTTLHVVTADGAVDAPYSEPFDHHSPPGMGTLMAPAMSRQGALAFRNADDCPDCAGGEVISVSREDGSGLQGLELDGGSPVVRSFDWSPDGGALVLERGAQVITVATLQPTADPAVIRLITRDLGVRGTSPVWSPDGTRIAYAGAEGVYVIAPSGGAPRLVAAATGIRGIDW